MKTRPIQLFGLCILSFTLVGLAQAEPLQLYFVRHAETMANVTGDYSVENQRVFSPRGEEQIEAITAVLADHSFDHIFVSPSPRAMRTIWPYLKASGQTAEIWIELDECCWDKSDAVEGTPILEGAQIEWPEGSEPYFHVSEEDDLRRQFAATLDMGQRTADMVAERIRERFSGTGKKVLIVSHYYKGRLLLEQIVRPLPSKHIHPHNARLTHLEENPDGTFHLRMLNGTAIPTDTPKLSLPSGK